MVGVRRAESGVACAEHNSHSIEDNKLVCRLLEKILWRHL